MRHWITVVGLTLSLVLAACGTGGTGADGTTDTTQGASGDTDDTPTLNELLGGFDFDPNDPEAAEAHFREQERRIQESIRACMAEQGFEYIPVEPPAEAFAFSPGDEDEFVKKQGFGITTFIGNEEQFEGPEVEFVDPNEENVQAMSESEREAYFEALQGSPEDFESTIEVDPETGEEIEVFEGFGAGCQGQAYEAEYGDQQVFEVLGPELEEMNSKVEADPRIIALQGEWAACMADKGYEYTKPQDMFETVFEDFQQRLEVIVGPNGGYTDPFEGWTEEEINSFFEEKTQEEIDAFFAEAEQGPKDYDEEALAALQAEEIELAVANYECSKDDNEVYEEVYREYESQFVKENRERIDELIGSDS